uniref:RING-type E3 ubiquitin transferase n=1 Tax=Cicer arietinum TaxID=3827 RepID=A0A1S2YCJ5_CICAR|nr:RING-H2 finger protein ATL74-like [Cicer arietinum]
MTLHHHLRRLLRNTNSSSTSAPDSNSSDSSIDPSYFFTNMVFIFVALLCAIIFSFGLHSIVKFALKCIKGRFASETQDETIVHLASMSVKKSALNNIPVVVYGSGTTTSFEAIDCPICLGEFMDGEKVRVLLKCNHGFHVGCVDKWLLSHSSCPICRQSLVMYPTSSEVGS